MKHQMKIVGIILILLAVGFSGCISDDDIGKKYIGTWLSEDGDTTITFNSDWTCETVTSEGTQQSSWEVFSGGKVKLNWEGVYGTYYAFFLEEQTKLSLAGVYGHEGTTSIMLIKQ